MKEVTYEDWLKNPTTRPMWVWNEDKDVVIRENNGEWHEPLVEVEE